MDPFRRISTPDTGGEWDTYIGDSDDASEGHSSEDDIKEIEEALLQRIHYAEDCNGDLSSAHTRGTSNDTFVHYREEQVTKITVTSLERQTNMDNFPSKNKTLASVERNLEPASDKPTVALTNKSPPYGSDSESESKYKAINSKKLAGKNDRMGRLVRSEVDVVAVNCTEGDSDVDSVSNSDILVTENIFEKQDQSIPALTKRQWRKSTEDPNTPTNPSSKVKLKRTVIDAELRTILDQVKEDSSEDDFSDVMVIESHSEDEALDVNYDSTATEGRGYYQDQSYERGRYRGRYYQEPENWPRYKCYNCLEFGHMTRDCPKPRQRKLVTCVLCGTQGHNDRQCPDALCYICSEPGHQARECPHKKRQYQTCRRCSMKGHTEQQCPDRWRQYHLTTEPGKIHCDESRKENQQLLAVNGKVFCYNCSKEGHFGHECWEEPMDRRAPLILPYVVRYDQIPRRFWKVQMDIAEPPECTLGFNDRWPDAGMNNIAPSVPPKKERKKTRMKRLRAEKLTAAAEGNQDKATEVTSTSQKKAKKGKKRKLEQTELIAVDNNDHVNEQVIKRCRKKNPEELAADKKLQEELASLPKAERNRIIRKRHVQSRKEALTREEILTDYEETQEYVQKGGHVLRKRNNSVREAIAMELAQLQAQPQPSAVGKKKKKKKPKQSRSERRAWRLHQQELQLQQQQQQQQQQVSFNFNFEQFPELEQKFSTQNQDDQLQQFQPEVNFDASSAANFIVQGKFSGAKKNRRKAKQKSKGGGPNTYSNVQGHTPELNMAPDDPSTKPMSKRQQKKLEYYKRLEQKKARRAWARAQQQVSGPSFKSERGFKVEPRY